VDRVLLAGTRATGVVLECAGVREEVRGDRVILAGGTIGSPTILLRSGIGPAAELRQVGIAPVVNLPGVGANLIEHAQVSLGLSAQPGLVDATTPFWQVLLRYTAPGSTEANDMQALLAQVPVAPTSILMSPLMRPRSRGVLRLARPDPHIPPTIALNLARCGRPLLCWRSRPRARSTSSRQSATTSIRWARRGWDLRTTRVPWWTRSVGCAELRGCASWMRR
jgi:choline dehydrogenase